MRIMVYSHDAFGLGNIRRMLAICEHLLEEIPQVSILLLSGSPMLQGFRLPRGLDYIKLPCLNRGNSGELAVKYLGMDIDNTVKMRSELILSATVNFKPDLVLVDKKPLGIKNELTAAINYLHEKLPDTKLVLLLREILDIPEKTIAEWRKNKYSQMVDKFYQLLLIVGSKKVFNFCEEYELPDSVVNKARFCGYIRRSRFYKGNSNIYQELKSAPGEKLVIVTPGGGQDGYQLINTYLQGQELLNDSQYHIKSLVFCGPEMPQKQKQELYQVAAKFPQVQMKEFTDDLISYLSAADAVVSMGGYNTICEILSADKSAVIVPRVKPSQEQLIRSQRMQSLGLLRSIHPEHLTSEALIEQVFQILDNPQKSHDIDLEGLPRITRHIRNLLADKITATPKELVYSQSYEYQELLVS